MVGLREYVRSVRQAGENTTETLDDHETRIRDLESERGKFVLPVAGVAALVADFTVGKIA